MSINNKVKAPRPCTLWGQTFDSNLVESITRKHYMDKNGNFLHSILVEKHYGGRSLAKIRGLEYGIKAFQEALQAIASAQRPWLKAEGFQFVQDVVYKLLHKDGSFLIGTPYLDTADSIFLLCDSNRNTFDNHIEFENFVAFKPISDSEEEWDAVAGVEVYKESTNDTKTNG